MKCPLHVILTKGVYAQTVSMFFFQGSMELTLHSQGGVSIYFDCFASLRLFFVPIYILIPGRSYTKGSETGE